MRRGVYMNGERIGFISSDGEKRYPNLKLPEVSTAENLQNFRAFLRERLKERGIEQVIAGLNPSINLAKTLAKTPDEVEYVKGLYEIEESLKAEAAKVASNLATRQASVATGAVQSAPGSGMTDWVKRNKWYLIAGGAALTVAAVGVGGYIIWKKKSKGVGQ
jgi:hypothetical protein